jgi:SAM-dependent methyltransferase
LLSAASFARYRHGPFGFFRVPRLPAGFRPVAVDCGGFVAARRGGFDYAASQYVQWLRQLDVAWAAIFDSPCKPELGLDVAAQQAATTYHAHWFVQHWPVAWHDPVVTADDRDEEGGQPGADDRNKYVLTQDWSGEQERLHLVEMTADEASIAAIRAAGFRPSWRCLDVGAGAGSIARWLAAATGDPARVFATDLDARLLVPLEREGLRVQVHDVVVDDFPSRSFDLIHARFVLEHLAAREEVIERVAEWLAPDGVLVLVDCASFPVLDSPNRSYRAAMRAWVDILATTGTDYRWPRTFPQPLQRHRYRDIGAMADVQVLQGGSPIARVMSLTLESLRHRIIDAGILSSSAIDDAQRLLADPDFWDLGPSWMAAWGHKPA